MNVCNFWANMGFSIRYHHYHWKCFSPFFAFFTKFLGWPTGLHSNWVFCTRHTSTLTNKYQDNLFDSLKLTLCFLPTSNQYLSRSDRPQHRRREKPFPSSNTLGLAGSRWLSILSPKCNLAQEKKMNFLSLVRSGLILIK